MKKVLVFLMLVLSTSMAMAQFGSLKELKEKEAQSGNGSNNNENPSAPEQNNKDTKLIDAQLIEKCIANGFFLVRQEYQLEDKANPGSRYNWGEDPYFDFGVSFMVRLTNGFVTTEEIVSPWTYDTPDGNKYTQYKNTHNPVFSKTLTMKVGQKGWKTEDKVFQPKEEEKLYNGLRFVKDEEWKGEGFLRASGQGKKTVYLVWIIEENEQENRSISYRIEQVEVVVDPGKNHCEVTVPEQPYHVQAIGGILVEPLYKGVGKMELALVGVVNNDIEGIDPINGFPVTITLLNQNMGEAADPDNDNTLVPTEKPNPKNKKNKRKS